MVLQAPTTFSFVGIDPETAELKREVIELVGAEYGCERVVDFGDIMAGWENTSIAGVQKRDLEPMERLAARGSLFIRNVRLRGVPLLRPDLIAGFFDRLGFDTWYGANGHRLDLTTLQLWEAFVEHGLKPLGFAPPAAYFHTDGNDQLRHLLHTYCTKLSGQHYEVIPSTLSRREKALMIFGIVRRTLDGRHRHASFAA